MKTSAEIRQSFLDFFASKGHTVVPSSSLVPGNDPTLLFTNAGMVQFKDVFLGAEKRSYNRAVSSQRCVRAGGKHNDLDSVGYTARHHTFFEMLGNFSFGDYFKRDAIRYAWDLLTGVWQIPAERLLVTIYHTDDEAFDIWHKEIGIAADKIIRIGDNKGAPFASDNFWQMADTGPCGPCTEIFYDHGAHIPGGPPGSPDEDGDRYIEIWNNVFMQFDRSADGTLTPLPAPCVDTGMGLERVCAVLQHVHSNYEIDLFQHLIKAAAALTETADLENKSLRVIADHIRACSFLIVDGVLPSNEGRGYVLRRIVRRALRHGYMLGQKQPFFHRMLGPLVEVMGGAYPELQRSREFIQNALLGEEEKFGDTLQHGMLLLERALNIRVPILRYIDTTRGWDGDYYLDSHLSGGISLDGFREVKEERIGVLIARSLESAPSELEDCLLKIHQHNEGLFQPFVELIFLMPKCDEDSAQAARVRQLAEVQTGLKVTPVFWSQDQVTPHAYLTGASIFKLYDTYGFPSDLTADVCRERGFTADLEGFEKEIDRQRKMSRGASQFESKGLLSAEAIQQLPPTKFLGYDGLSAENLVLVGILRNNFLVQELGDGDEATLVLDRTPFYAESGGQVGDRGVLRTQFGEFVVRDTVKLAGAFHGHVGRWSGKTLRVTNTLHGEVDGERRRATVLNHSATHLLHAALRQVLGDHVHQKGSYVGPDRLRFDFSHFQPMTARELQRIEDIVNAQVRHNDSADIRNMAYKDALDFGAMALFGEKYGEHVRVLKFGDFSTELCGGTHVARTGDIGLMKIVSEAGVGSGLRRIEAVTGAGALAYISEEERRLGEVNELLAASGADVVDKLRQLFDRQKKLERELESLKAKAASAATQDIAASAQDVAGVKVVAARLDGLDAKALREAVDQLKQKFADLVVLLAAGSAGKVSLIGGVQGAALGKVKAGDLVGHVAQQIGGKGGGRPDMAQGGGEDTPALASALAGVAGWVSQRLE
jgi:alanyl-tRNA synthetase